MSWRCGSTPGTDCCAAWDLLFAVAVLLKIARDPCGEGPRCVTAVLSAAAPLLSAAASSKTKHQAQDPAVHLVASTSPRDLQSSRYRQTFYSWVTSFCGRQAGQTCGNRLPRSQAPHCYAPCCDLAFCSINTQTHTLLYIISCYTPLPGEKAREQT